ncbi:MAG: hypothetical protein ACREAY_04875 [Nitrososphaera sp.]
MTVCTGCNTESDRTLNCAHTEGHEVCVECYQQIHWLLTEKHD